MHEGAAAPSSLRPGLGLRRAGVSVRKRCLRTSSRAKRGLRNPQNRLCRFKVGSPLGFQVGFADRDGKIGDFDAAPLERPKWPLPLSFFFSPRAAFYLPGVPALRSACSARPATRREYARQIYDLPSLVALRAPSRRCPRAFSRVNAASDRPSPKVTEGGRALARLATANNEGAL